jgi:hypothetical protein
MLEGQFQDGDRIVIDVDGDELVFKKEQQLVTSSPQS